MQNQKKMLLAGIAAVFAVLPEVQAAQVYTCNIGGTVVYTSRMGANCHGAQLPTLGSYTSSRRVYADQQPRRSEPKESDAEKKTAARKANSAPVQVAAPKMPGNSGRRSILEQELANERQALAKAQSELASARTAQNGSIDQQRINSLQSSVSDRQLNIQALQRELSRM